MNWEFTVGSAIGGVMAAAYVWCYRVAVTPEHLNRYWPFKLRDLPETKSLLIPEPEAEKRPHVGTPKYALRNYPGKVFNVPEYTQHQLGRMRDEHFELLYGKNYEEYRRKFVLPTDRRNYGNIQSAGLQNSTPNYHPSELQNASTDVDLFEIEMARNANAPDIPDSPAADFGGGDSGGGGASDSWSGGDE